MKRVKRFGIMLLVALAAVAGSEFAERLSVPNVHSLIPTAEAIVGRPLKPVSVAGVGGRASLGAALCGRRLQLLVVASAGL